MPTVFASKGQGLCNVTQYINAPCGYPDIGAVRVVDALDYPYQYDKFATSGTRYFQVETKVDCYVGITVGTFLDFNYGVQVGNGGTATREIGPPTHTHGDGTDFEYVFKINSLDTIDARTGKGLITFQLSMDNADGGCIFGKSAYEVAHAQPRWIELPNVGDNEAWQSRINIGCWFAFMITGPVSVPGSTYRMEVTDGAFDPNGEIVHNKTFIGDGTELKFCGQVTAVSAITGGNGIGLNIVRVS